MKSLAIVKAASEVKTGLMLPIPYFGDVEAYAHSKIRIVTVGLNPSNREFQKGKSEKIWSPRFRLTDSLIKPNYLRNQLNNYFEHSPYREWFNNFEQVLNGACTSYYKNNQTNVAIHLDLCSPIATAPTWSKLKKNRIYQNKKN